MPRGGKRPGAGRPKGALSKRREELARKALEADVTPLDVMIWAMNDAMQKKERDEAAKYAQMAAPYVHPKLASVQHSGDASEPLRLVVATGIPDDEDEPGDDEDHAGEDH